MATVEEKVRTIVEKADVLRGLDKDLTIDGYRVIGDIGTEAWVNCGRYSLPVDWWLAFVPLVYDEWERLLPFDRDNLKQEYTYYYYEYRGKRYYIPVTVYQDKTEIVGTQHEDKDGRFFMENLDKAFVEAQFPH